MSHAHGMVRFEDGEVLHYEYDGTSDVVCPALKRTAGEVSNDWRSPRNWSECNCGGEGEPVEIVTNYGAMSAWKGRACRTCMAVTKGLMPWDEDDAEMGREIPAWATAIWSNRPS